MLDFQMLWSLVWAFPGPALDVFLGTIVLTNQTSHVHKVVSGFKRPIIFGDACRCVGVDGHHLGFGGVNNEACLLSTLG